MYSYSYDATTGGIVLNSSPTVFSKEPRPVWAAEMNLLGFHQYWNYDEQNDIPYMWAESNAYWYWTYAVSLYALIEQIRYIEFPIQIALFHETIQCVEEYPIVAH